MESNDSYRLCTSDLIFDTLKLSHQFTDSCYHDPLTTEVTIGKL